MFVVTLRCDHSCPYCQVSRVSEDRRAFDMTQETARRAIDLVFRSPNPAPKVEFQGGESLLNFDLIRWVVLEVERRNVEAKKDVEFVVATNLSSLTDEMLSFLAEHRVLVSTSLDGPRDLHNANRPRPGGNGYERTVAGIERCRAALGHDRVAALTTTTRRSLSQPEAIVDEYVARGFSNIFLRWLSPYGFAAKTAAAIGYGVADWATFYERGLRHVLGLNRRGTRMREEYAAIVLRKMLTPYGSGYVDLQSPAGLGISGVVYNYDGDVYASDEARMLAEAGDKTFRLGNVHTDTYEDVFLSERLSEALLATMTESTPMCVDCAFEPYCGTDPTFHKATQGDMVGHRPTSAFCARNMFVFKLLMRILEDEPENGRILRSWV
jgi:His-Xaa-Ser system radical SAM maturase HxsB